MTIPRLMGPYDSAAENLQGLGKALRKIINPNYERQEFVKNKMLEDPTYAQTLADQEAESPGILKGMGLDDNTINTIIKRQQSPESVVKTKMRGVLNNVNLDDPDTRDALGDKFLGIDRLGREATRAGIEATKTGTARTKVLTEGDKLDQYGQKLDNDLKAAQATLTPQLIASKSAELNQVIADITRKQTARETLTKLAPQLKGKNLVEARKEIDPEQFSLLMQDEGFADMYDKDWKERMAKNEQTFQLSLVRSKPASQDAFSREFEKQLARNADALTDKGINPMAAVQYLQLNSTDQLRYEQEPNRPEDPTQAALWDAAQVQKQIVKERMFQAKNTGILAQLRKDVRLIESQSTRATDPIAIDEAINQMNLQAELALGKGRLVFGKIPVGSRFGGLGKKYGIGVIGGSEVGMGEELGFNVIDDPIAKEAWDEINSGVSTLDQLLKDPGLPPEHKSKILTYRSRYEKKKPMSETRGAR